MLYKLILTGLFRAIEIIFEHLQFPIKPLKKCQSNFQICTYIEDIKNVSRTFPIRTYLFLFL